MNFSGKSRIIAALTATVIGGATFMTMAQQAQQQAGQDANEGKPVVSTPLGRIEGRSDGKVDTFKGVKYGQAPVGEYRWRASRPVEAWDTVMVADHFGASPMQPHLYEDIFLHSDMDEDCLFLNIWTPAGAASDATGNATTTVDTANSATDAQGAKNSKGLPVLIYFNGGGLTVGSGSEPRYGGYTLASEGIIVVTANYREGIFGFFSHPELTAENPQGASGNYGFMDQLAAIKWVKDNIAAFGGDPDRITIAGESAGSISVSSLMASPLARGLFSQAIGSSGGALFYEPIATLSEAEELGMEQARVIGCSTLEELRALPADELLRRNTHSAMRAYNVDGYVFEKQPMEVYRAGEQMHIPLLVGGNSQETKGSDYVGPELTLEALKIKLGDTFGEATDSILALYEITSDSDVASGMATTNLASDLWIAYSTHNWATQQSLNSGQPVYFYTFTRPRPGTSDPGAVHSTDIEYAMGNLATNTTFPWTADDYRISDFFRALYRNFVTTGNPNSATGILQEGEEPLFWPEFKADEEAPAELIIDVTPKVVRDATKAERYRRADAVLYKPEAFQPHNK